MIAFWIWHFASSIAAVTSAAQGLADTSKKPKARHGTAQHSTAQHSTAQQVHCTGFTARSGRPVHRKIQLTQPAQVIAEAGQSQGTLAAALLAADLALPGPPPRGLLMPPLRGLLGAFVRGLPAFLTAFAPAPVDEPLLLLNCTHDSNALVKHRRILNGIITSCVDFVNAASGRHCKSSHRIPVLPFGSTARPAAQFTMFGSSDVPGLLRDKAKVSAGSKSQQCPNKRIVRMIITDPIF